MSVIKQLLSQKNNINNFVHLLCWIIIFATPLVFLERDAEGYIVWRDYLSHISVPISFLILFYANYSIFTPSFIFNSDMDMNKKIIYFVSFNIYMILLANLFIFFWEGQFGPNGYNDDHLILAHPVGFFVRNTSLCIVCVLVSVLLRASADINVMYAKMKEVEKAKTEAELQNLKSQFNPHFLLNTLNNIYSLIQFDTEKAQSAVSDLSDLLRYAIYDSRQEFVPLIKEVEFIKDYIELMKIRLDENSVVSENFDVHSEKTMIAPMLFISLIENAFKHGVSNEEDNFIDISISESSDGKTVICSISNSYHPKDNYDKSGSGIGLEQVRRRLELIYPNHYTWNQSITPDNKVYESKIIISL